MKSMIKWALLASATVFAPLLWGAFIKAESLKAESPEKVPYPDGYRRWTHVRSGLTGPESPDFKNTGGIHHINDLTSLSATRFDRDGTFSTHRALIGGVG